MPYFETSDKTKIYYEDVGLGLPLLFVHGWGSSQGVWRYQKDYFSDRYRVLSCDLRGHGASDWSVSDETCPAEEQVFHDIRELCEALDLRDLVLVGWSFGSSVCLRCALELGGRVSGMILVGGNVKFVADEDYPHALSPDIVQRIRVNYERSQETTLKACFKTFFSPKELLNKHLYAFMFEDIKIPHKAGSLVLYDRLSHIDLRPTLRHIEIPVLICHGTSDGICLPEAGRLMERAIPSSRLIFFEGGGHAVFITESTRFNQHIEHFVTQCRGR